jgi:hypothetical protein
MTVPSPFMLRTHHAGAAELCDEVDRWLSTHRTAIRVALRSPGSDTAVAWSDTLAALEQALRDHAEEAGDSVEACQLEATADRVAAVSTV